MAINEIRIKHSLGIVSTVTFLACGVYCGNDSQDCVKNVAGVEDKYYSRDIFSAELVRKGPKEPSEGEVGNYFSSPNYKSLFVSNWMVTRRNLYWLDAYPGKLYLGIFLTEKKAREYFSTAKERPPGPIVIRKRTINAESLRRYFN